MTTYYIIHILYHFIHYNLNFNNVTHAWEIYYRYYLYA